MCILDMYRGATPTHKPSLLRQYSHRIKSSCVRQQNITTTWPIIISIPATYNTRIAVFSGYTVSILRRRELAYLNRMYNGWEWLGQQDSNLHCRSQSPTYSPIVLYPNMKRRKRRPYTFTPLIQIVGKQPSIFGVPKCLKITAIYKCF